MSLNKSISNDRAFIDSIKISKDPDMDILLKIQEEIEKKGINKANILELTKNLSSTQKQKLENLYKSQIEEYKLSIQKHKDKIVSIRKNLK
jgi:SOS response regulatory protein OraA/RecX